MLKSIPVPGIIDYEFPPSLFFHLIKGRFNVIIAAGAAQLDTMVAFLAARLLRRPFILWNVEWFYNTSILSRLRYPFWKLIVLSSDAVVLPGKKSKKFHMICGVSEDKIFMSPNASELEPTEPDESLRDTMGLKTSDRVILCFTRISPEKGLEYLVDSYSYITLENVKIIIATTLPFDKNYARTLIAKAKAIGNNNIFIKVFKDDQKAQLYNLCNVFVMPSITKQGVGPEVWGMALNDALSAGKPLIASASVGGAYDMIVQGKNGYIVNERDSRMLGTMLYELLDSPHLKEMGEYSKALYLKKFKLTNEVQGFIEAISSIKS